ncbi:MULTISPECIES: DUF930 domain-containing protein [unclassified Mesorhizobium]|uniref:DUF930 domain-containing protein n=1 Tax=unclassified Mesorhizobium TaxID=325217 RepID=UPI001FE1F493|nr:MULTISPECIES: DUF930 domain-containing protein [unclassified Mesorhizobium]
MWGSVAAEGAAFRSRGSWHGLKFRCGPAGDGDSVIGFEFLVSDEREMGRSRPARGVDKAI